MARAWKYLRITLLSLAALIGAFFLWVAIGALIPANADWEEPERGVQIYVFSSGVHTGIVMPMRAAGVDWTRMVRPEHLAEPSQYGDYVEFGWGSEVFYNNVPRWADLTIPIALKAGLGGIAADGGGPGLVHVQMHYRPRQSAWLTPVTVTREQYYLLADHVRAAFAYDETGAPVVARKGYHPNDVFYEGKPGYSVFNSCNSWTGEGLREAGIKTGLWTPFADGVTRWLPPGQNEAS